MNHNDSINIGKITPTADAVKAANAVSKLQPIIADCQEGESADFYAPYYLREWTGLRQFDRPQFDALMAEVPYDNRSVLQQRLREWKDEDTSDWPELSVPTVDDSVSRDPYPVESFPPLAVNAIKEVQDFIQAPEALIGAEVLAAMSASCQGLYEVERASGLSGPVSLYLNTVAVSGERKTAVASRFSEPVVRYERECADRLAPEVQRRLSEIATHAAIADGLKLSLKSEVKANKADKIAKIKEEIVQHDLEKPEPIKVPRLLTSDFTPEALVNRAHKEYPIVFCSTSEGGTFFQSHGMGKDSRVRNFAALNVLWDGGPLSVDRKTSDSFRMEGARLTICTSVQPSVFQDFISNSDGLADGSGFTARVLTAFPESTQGTRKFRHPPAHWPAVTAFNDRIYDLLNKDVEIEASGGVVARKLTFSPDAQAAWIDFHDRVESLLGKNQQLSSIPAIASKIADNAARISALFEALTNDNPEAISLESFKAAERVAGWYLLEALNLNARLKRPLSEINAEKLKDWLIARAKEHPDEAISALEVMQYGPRATRSKQELTAAMLNLSEWGAIKVAKDGRRKTITVNPLLTENHS